MKKIINGKLYDTEKADLILKFRKKVNIKSLFGDIYTWANSELYKTKNDAWFEVVGVNFENPEINSITTEQAKEIIITDPDKFCELYPNEVEDA